MYPQRELTALALQKVKLRRKIEAQRLASAEAIAGLAAPLDWLERARALWRRFTPLLHILLAGAGVWAKRSPSTLTRLLGVLLRWGPVLLAFLRRIVAARPSAAAPVA